VAATDAPRLEDTWSRIPAITNVSVPRANIPAVR
jgi:hypothetical protein